MPVAMNCCMQCGARLVRKYLPSEGREIPYCEACGDFRFPFFNTAVSMIVLTPDLQRVLLIRQYGRPDYILVAGYVNQGEDAEDAVCREVREETGLTVARTRFNHSHFFVPSNTLMLNFTAVCTDDRVHENSEVDTWSWFSPEEARRNIRPHSLAKSFLEGYLDGHWTFEPPRP